MKRVVAFPIQWPNCPNTMKPMASSRLADICHSFILISNFCFDRIRAISLDLIKRRLDKVLYKRLDIFQEDVFACLERARKLSRTDSQVFEDSVELQSYFIRKRDDVSPVFRLKYMLYYQTVLCSFVVTCSDRLH